MAPSPPTLSPLPRRQSSAAVVPPKATGSNKSKQRHDEPELSASGEQRLGKAVERVRKRRQQERSVPAEEERTDRNKPRSSSSSNAAIVRSRRTAAQPTSDSSTESEQENAASMPPLSLDRRVTRSSTSQAAVVPARRSKLEADDEKLKAEEAFAKLLPTPHLAKLARKDATPTAAAKRSEAENGSSTQSPAISVHSSPDSTASPASSNSSDLHHPASTVKRQRVATPSNGAEPDTSAAGKSPTQLPTFVSPFAELAKPTPERSLGDFKKPKPVHRPRKLNPVNPHASNARYAGFGKRHKQHFNKGAAKHTDKTRAGWLRTHGMIKKCMPRLIHIVQSLLTEDAGVQNAINYELRHNSALHDQVIALPPRSTETPDIDPVHRWRILYKACATLLRGWRLYPEIAIAVTASCLRHLAGSAIQNDDLHPAHDVTRSERLIRFYRQVMSIVDKTHISWKSKPFFIVDLAYDLSTYLYRHLHHVSEAHNALTSRFIRGYPFTRDLRLTVLYAEVELAKIHQTEPTHGTETLVKLDQSPPPHSPSSPSLYDEQLADQPGHSPSIDDQTFNARTNFKDENIEDEMDDYAQYLDESAYADAHIDRSPVTNGSASPADGQNAMLEAQQAAIGNGLSSTSVTSLFQHRSRAIELLSDALRYAYHRPQPPYNREELLVQAAKMLLEVCCGSTYVQPLLDAQLISSIDTEVRTAIRVITEFRVSHLGDAVAWHMELLLLQYLLSHDDELELPVDLIEQCHSQQIYVAYQLHLHSFHSTLAFNTLVNEWNTNKYAVQIIPQWLVADVVLRYLCMLLHAQTVQHTADTTQQLQQTYAALADVLDHLLVDVSGPYAVNEIRDQPLSRDDHMQLIPIDIEASPSVTSIKQQPATVAANISFDPTRWLTALHQYRDVLSQTADPSPLHRMAVNDLNAYISNVEQVTAKLQRDSSIDTTGVTPASSPLSAQRSSSNVPSPLP